MASSGKSTNTGPRCGVVASRNASSTEAATRAAACSVHAALGDRGEQRHVVQLLQRALAPQVVGGPAAEHDDRGAVEPGATVTALTLLVTPGPAVTTASPGVLVSRAVPSAANTAVCSCRTSTSRSGGSALTAPS